MELRIIHSSLKNKKGLLFTTLILLLFSVFLLVYTTSSLLTERGPITKRIKEMNNFIFSLEKDMTRQIYISGYRAIVSLENYITQNGIFINDSEASLKELLINGSIDNQNISLMDGFRLQDWNSRVSDLSSSRNLNVNYTLEYVNISQTSPWTVSITMGISISLSDRGGLASWNQTKEIISNINIEGFEDPLYIINSNIRIANKIEKSNYTGFTDGSNVSNLSDHMTNSYYVESASGPSFLDRLEGKTTPNIYGIESFVNLDEFMEQDLPTETKSCIDYIYFSTSNPTSWQVAGMPSWFRIDNESNHLGYYEVEGLVY